jgi:hypothetical protein
MGLDWSRYVKLPDDPSDFGKVDHLRARDAMVANLRDSGDSYARARAIADATATKHDRRGKP